LLGSFKGLYNVSTTRLQFDEILLKAAAHGGQKAIPNCGIRAIVADKDLVVPIMVHRRNQPFRDGKEILPARRKFIAAVHIKPHQGCKRQKKLR
jgi:hypothetical protein